MNIDAAIAAAHKRLRVATNAHCYLALRSLRANIRSDERKFDADVHEACSAISNDMAALTGYRYVVKIFNSRLGE